MTYRNGKHLQKRANSGQFSRWSLSDFNTGTAICPKCGAINPYELKTPVTENGFVFMRRNEPPKICASCGHSLEENHVEPSS